MNYPYIIHAKHHRIVDVFDDYIHSCAQPFSAHIELRGEVEFALAYGRIHFLIDRRYACLGGSFELVG